MAMDHFIQLRKDTEQRGPVDLMSVRPPTPEGTARAGL